MLRLWVVPYGYFQPFFTSLAASHGLDLVEDGRDRTITKVIDNVSWTTEKKLRETGQWTERHNTCVELPYVQDADRLDPIGAFGIMRCAACSTAAKRPLYTPAGDADHAHTVIQDFHDKLLNIRDRLKTGPSKKMGNRRH